MEYKLNGRFKDSEVFCINHISKNNETTCKKIYRIKCNDRYRNIVEEDNTLYEIDDECIDRYKSTE